MYGDIKIWDEYRAWAKQMIKIIKPWKVRENLDKPIHQVDYEVGWNDCLKEMTKNTNKYFKEMDDLIKKAKEN